MDKQWKPRSSLAVFVSALHLLDLDTFKDWPSITVSTFHSKSTSQILQAKVKATEWALYQLFQIYSPDSARQVLSAHFPPKTPIQSLNLRAGLFKLLTELKKNALLPRETILRKTMLDECKGDKFEDLLAAFSMLVLRKVLSEGKGKALATSKSTKPEHVVPLIIAHHVSLQGKLKQRQKLRGDARDHVKSLEIRRADLAERLQALSRSDDNGGARFSQADDKALREKVVYAFAADPRWAKFLFDGNVTDGSTSLVRNAEMSLTRPPDGSAIEMPAFSENPLTQQANKPISQLKSLVSQQKTRIQHLEGLQASLLSGEPTPPKVIPTEDSRALHRRESLTNAPLELRFNRHKALNLNSISV